MKFNYLSVSGINHVDKQPIATVRAYLRLISAPARCAGAAAVIHIGSAFLILIVTRLEDLEYTPV